MGKLPKSKELANIRRSSAAFPGDSCVAPIVQGIHNN